MQGLNEAFDIEMVLKANTLFDYGMRYYINDKSLLESVLLKDLRGFFYERLLKNLIFIIPMSEEGSMTNIMTNNLNTKNNLETLVLVLTNYKLSENFLESILDLYSEELSDFQTMAIYFPEKIFFAMNTILFTILRYQKISDGLFSRIINFMFLYKCQPIFNKETSEICISNCLVHQHHYMKYNFKVFLQFITIDSDAKYNTIKQILPKDIELLDTFINYYINKNGISCLNFIKDNEKYISPLNNFGMFLHDLNINIKDNFELSTGYLDIFTFSVSYTYDKYIFIINLKGIGTAPRLYEIKEFNKNDIISMEEEIRLALMQFINSSVFLYERKLEIFNFLNNFFDALNKKLIKDRDIK